ncbi:MAG: hypothetical protein Q4D52_06405 [Eubacteriales bacterium]|nr:hypothetical protein [Eubacteriales bacterium]
MTKYPMEKNKLRAVSGRTFVSAFQRKWLHMLAGLLIGAGLAFSWAQYTGINRFVSSVSLEAPAEVVPEAISSEQAFRNAAETLDLSVAKTKKTAVVIDKKDTQYVVKVEAKTPVQAQQAANRFASAVVEQTPAVVVSQAAQLPENPVRSVWKRWLMIGAGIGLAVSVVLHILIEMCSLRIKNSRELELCIGSPEVTNIPTITRSESAEEDLQDVAVWVTEVLKKGSVAFVGATRGSGASMIAASVAGHLAAAGKQVLLVDADIESEVRPNDYPASANQNGLVQFLRGSCGISQILSETDVPGLTMIQAGGSMEDELTDAHIEKIGEVIQATGSYFDYVIVDTPNYEEYQDGVDLAAFCNGVMMVIRKNLMRSKDCRDMAEELAALEKTELIGAIINRSRK